MSVIFLSLIKSSSLLSASDVVSKGSRLLIFGIGILQLSGSTRLNYGTAACSADNTEQKGTTLFFYSLQSFHQSRSSNEYFRRYCAVVYKVMLKEFRILWNQKVKILDKQ